MVQPILRRELKHRDVRMKSLNGVDRRDAVRKCEWRLCQACAVSVTEAVVERNSTNFVKANAFEFGGTSKIVFVGYECSMIDSKCCKAWERRGIEVTANKDSFISSAKHK